MYPVPGGKDGPPCECPECGARVDARDPATLARRRFTKAQHRLAHAPGVIECGVAACPGLLACVAVSAPEGYFLPIVLSAFGTMAILAWWLVRVFVATIVGWRWERLGAVLRQPGWAAMPAVLVAVGALSFTTVPARMVRWCEGGRLAAAVQQALAIQAAGGDDAALAAVAVDFALLPGTGRVSPDALAQLREWVAGHGTGAAGDWTQGGVAITVPQTGFLFEQGAYFFLPNLKPRPGDPAIPSRILTPLGDGWYAGRLEDHR